MNLPQLMHAMEEALLKISALESTIDGLKAQAPAVNPPTRQQSQAYEVPADLQGLIANIEAQEEKEKAINLTAYMTYQYHLSQGASQKAGKFYAENADTVRAGEVLFQKLHRAQYEYKQS